MMDANQRRMVNATKTVTPRLQDDGLRFYRGLLIAILPSLLIWAMLIGAVIWALNS